MKITRFSLCTAAAFSTLLLAAPDFAISADGPHAHGDDQDKRQVLLLDASERHFLLSEMREFLVVVQRIVAANQAGNMQEVAEIGRASCRERVFRAV